jgi:hypothetical protein
MAFQDTMVENKISLEIIVIDKNAFLSRFETESGTHFQQELLKVVKDGGFEFGF